MNPASMSIWICVWWGRPATDVRIVQVACNACGYMHIYVPVLHMLYYVITYCNNMRIICQFLFSFCIIFDFNYEINVKIHDCT